MFSLLALALVAAPLDETAIELQWMQHFAAGATDPVWMLEAELVVTGEGPARAIAYESPQLTRAVGDAGAELMQLPDVFEPEDGVWKVERREGEFLAQPAGALRFDFGLSLPPKETKTLTLEGTYRMLTGGTDQGFTVAGLRGEKRKVEDETLAKAGVELSVEASQLTGFAVQVAPGDKLDNVEITDGQGSVIWPDSTSFDFSENGQTVSFLWNPKSKPLTAGVQVSWTAEDGSQQKEELRDIERARETSKLGPFDVLVTDATLSRISVDIGGREELLTQLKPIDGQGADVPFEVGPTFHVNGVAQRTFQFPDGLPDAVALEGAVRIGAEWTAGAFELADVPLPKRHF